MTEQPGAYNLTNPNPDAIKWLDTLIEAHENEVLEILENALWHLSSHVEGEETLSTDELLKRIRGALARIRGKVLDKDIEERL